MCPTYEYICENCKYEEERFGYNSQCAKVDKCPNCSQQSFIRCIGIGEGIHFKGTGFYSTDYKKQKDAQKDAKKMKEEWKKWD